MKTCSFFIGVVLLLFSCTNGSNDGNPSAVYDAADMQDSCESEVSFPFPSIPVMITNPEDRRAYLLRHYWDEFDFEDTSLVDNREVTEQAFVNQVSLMADVTADYELLRGSLDNFCSGMEKYEHARNVCMQMVDDYLYSPNSPYYNEILYRLYLERMLESRFLDDVRKSTLSFHLELIKRNSPGSVATDFLYYMPDGRMNTLHETPVKGDRLLLVFYDPECASCHDVMLQMTSDKVLAAAVASGELTVLAVYTEGNTDEWRKTVSSMPKGWIVGEDRLAVREGSLYDLKAMPSLYLLDKDKKVLLKDVPYDSVRRLYADVP